MTAPLLMSRLRKPMALVIRRSVKAVEHGQEDVGSQVEKGERKSLVIVRTPAVLSCIVSVTERTASVTVDAAVKTARTSEPIPIVSDLQSQQGKA